ncbi:MAG: hypothetical protein SFY81_03855 [Verrucomicrobiota bacterium]|nr:hypothetical protein [Verrucomicrobiota bacterium]
MRAANLSPIICLILGIGFLVVSGIVERMSGQDMASNRSFVLGVMFIVIAGLEWDRAKLFRRVSDLEKELAKTKRQQAIKEEIDHRERSSREVISLSQ